MEYIMKHDLAIHENSVTQIRELSLNEIEEVNGGVAPVVIGVGIAAATGAVSGYASGGLRGAATGAALGAGAAVAGAFAATAYAAGRFFYAAGWAARSIGLGASGNLV
ncbi:class IIb bacteriocin, lactobin A/cerein 7B family [Alteromonadaceae bacterium M269]|nr:class IIb bacteriocin, lactobin A/cerein 7B family [Alteromonadaceae bacterium M269]